MTCVLDASASRTMSQIDFHSSLITSLRDFVKATANSLRVWPASVHYGVLVYPSVMVTWWYCHRRARASAWIPPTWDYRQFLAGAGNRTPVLRRAAWSHLSSPFFVFPRNPHNKPGMVVCQCAVLGKQRQEGLNSYPAQPGWCAPGSSSAWLVCPRIMKDPTSKR